jgi:hypothetical protein
VLTGKVQKGFLLKLKVNRGGGSVIDTVEIKGGGSLVKLKAAIDSSGADTVGGPIGVTKAAAAEDKKPDDAPAGAEEEKKDDEEKPADASPSSSSDSDEHHGLSPLEVTAGLRPYHRTFEFHDTVASLRPGMGFTDLLRYELPLGPALFIDLNFFPGSLVAKGPAEWVGITAGFEKGFATQSLYAENTPNEKTLKTDMQSWYAGLRFRLPLGEHQLGLAATYGQHQFNLKGDEVSPTCSVCPLVPDVKYGYVKIGLDGEFHFGDFIAGARIGKRIVMSTGELKSVWFPNVKAQSLEAGLTAGYRLVSVLDLLVGFDWLRYAFNFNPVPLRMPAQANYVAGGAVDEYFSGNIAFRFHMPASGGAQ